MRMHNPPHPGLVLREYDIAVSTAAAHLQVTRVTMSRVLNGKAGISANMALRLGAARRTSGSTCRLNTIFGEPGDVGSLRYDASRMWRGLVAKMRI
jgi:addiction module HigA family antidote